MPSTPDADELTWTVLAFPVFEAVALGLACAALFVGLGGVSRTSRGIVVALFAVGVVGGAAALGALLVPGPARGALPAAAFGALFGGSGVAWLAARRLALQSDAVLAALAPSLGVLVAVGRVGCFAAGCCFGVRAHLPWGVSFVHPTQLYESALGFGMLVVSYVLVRRGRRAGSFAASLGLYAVGRFVIEFFRGDPRGVAGPFTVAQWLAIATLAAIVAKATARQA